MKSISTVLGALILLAAPAFAEGVQPATNGDLPDAACAYPGGPKTPGHLPTLLSYIGTANGTLVDLRVERPSGDPAQDAAVLACARQWHFDPATAVGKLNIGAHHLNLGWSLVNGETVLHRIGIPHLCTQYYPIEAKLLRIGGTTIVQFTITAEGAVRDPAIVVSSGNADLDAASLLCVHEWRYRPAVKDGQPVEAPWKAEIKWVAPPPPPEVSTLPVPMQ